MRFKENKGITLIALVITIIILIILAGISINLILGQNGLIKRAKNSTDDYLQAQAREKLEMILADLQVEKQINPEYNEDEFLNKVLIENGLEVEEDIVTVDGWNFEIDRDIPKIIGNIGREEDKKNNLIAWYDGIKNTETGHNYETTTWSDLTGNNITGATINGATWTEEGLLFDGSNDWVNMNSILMPEQENFTLDIVMSLNSYTNNQYYILGQNNDSSDATNRFGLNYYNSQINIWGSMITSGISSGYNPKLTEKVNVTIIRDGNNIELWINGEKKSEQSKEGLKIYQENTILGKWGMSNYYYFKGIIYSIKVYNENLTKEQVEKNYNKNNKRFSINNSEKEEIGQYVNEGLIAWYDGIKNTETGHNYETTTWSDLTGNNITGATINGATWTMKGLLFDGTNDWVNMNSILMSEQENFTLEVVMSLNSYTNSQYYILGQNGSSDATNRFGLNYYNSQINIWGSMITSGISSGYNPKLTEKVNVTIIRNGNNIELWINGEKKSEQSKEGLKIYQENTILGKWGMSKYYYFDGIIYSVRKYNRVLTNEEMQQNYNIDKLKFDI